MHCACVHHAFKNTPVYMHFCTGTHTHSQDPCRQIHAEKLMQAHPPAPRTFFCTKWLVLLLTSVDVVSMPKPTAWRVCRK